MKWYIGITCICSMAYAQETMEFPSYEELIKLFKQKGFDFIFEKTTLLEELAGQKKYAHEIYHHIEKAYKKYADHINQPIMVAALEKNKRKLFALLVTQEKVLEELNAIEKSAQEKKEEKNP